MSKFGERMKNLIEKSKDPVYQRTLLVKDLNNASFDITTHNVLRPTYTIHPNMNQTLRTDAEKLAEILYKNEDEFLESIQVKGLISLVSTNFDSARKIQILNFAIKWLLKHEPEVTTLNYLLMSISAYFFPIAQIGKIRLAIFLYITSPDLNKFFDIHLRECGNMFIHRKLGIPGDPSVADLYYDEETQVKYCNIVNNVTDNYINHSWPEGNRRTEREGPTEAKKRKLLLIEFATVQDLENPLFKWDFGNYGIQIDQREKQSAHSNMLSQEDVRESGLSLEKDETKSAPFHTNHSPHNSKQTSPSKAEKVLDVEFHNKCLLDTPGDDSVERNQEDSESDDQAE